MIFQRPENILLRFNAETMFHFPPRCLSLTVQKHNETIYNGIHCNTETEQLNKY